MPFEVDLVMQTKSVNRNYTSQLTRESDFSKRVGRIAHPVDRPTINHVIVDYMTLNKRPTSRSSL